MAYKSGAKGNSRDLGLSHGAGKGDKSRVTRTREYRENFDLIDWGHTQDTRSEPMKKFQRGLADALKKWYPKTRREIRAAALRNSEFTGTIER